ncbi:serine/threonine protein kinase [Tengunoibacter tsumagoiensis]|uniref:Protein kinase domain-containing protein n=1 Tax=Tengunoibacter tsumagoiensis TaxID=2014871 RepID=A0A402A1U2_9CHLR|nr:serine/threonine-protein kinase [Tengunoibacter tsumagoiensis]GCE13120.1 hypothetical protein KTT_29790 [Tengunoibacter tsumagoiensis]
MADRVGQRLGNYTITQLLGQGGFAEVYLGEHLYLKSQAAIKVLQARLSSTDDMDSFLKEAQTIARLAHPNIVRVMDFGIDEETPYLVMDYAPNGTLRQRHAKGIPLPLTTILPYITQVADALQYAHDERLIHRDIKPENMLIGRRNEILLSDFGIALVAQSSLSQGTQDVIGTVAYMSPEQIQGKPRPASDQYSLGIVAYEWLTGERPFHGSFTEMCTQHMFAQPPLLSEKLTQVSPAIEQVIMRALAKDPKQRFETIRDFATALQNIQQSGDTALRTGQIDLENNSYRTELMQPPPSYRTELMPPTQATPSSPITPGKGLLSRAQYTQNTPTNSQTGNQTGQQTTGQGSNQAINQPSQAPAQNSQPSALPTLHSMETEARTNPPQMILPPPPPGTPNQFRPQQQGNPTTPQSGQDFQNRAYQPPLQSGQPYPGQPYNNQQGIQYPGQPYGGPQQSGQSYGNPQQGNPYPGQPYGNQQGNQYPGNQYAPAQSYESPQQAAQREAAQREAAQREAAQRETAQRETAQREAAQREAAQREAVRTNQKQNQATGRSESFEESWGILATWKWPILATIVGIILFCAIHNLTIFPLPSFPVPVLNRGITLVVVIPLFFGASFGPWVGLLVGLGGVLCGDLFYPIDNHFHLINTAHKNIDWWAPLLINGIAGLLTGLTKLRRKYPSVGSVTRAVLLAAIGLAASLGFVLYQLQELSSYQFLGLVLLCNLIISFAILVVYSIMIRLVDPSI